MNRFVDADKWLQKQTPMKCKKRYYDDEDEETGKNSNGNLSYALFATIVSR